MVGFRDGWFSYWLVVVLVGCRGRIDCLSFWLVVVAVGCRGSDGRLRGGRLSAHSKLYKNDSHFYTAAYLYTCGIEYLGMKTLPNVATY